MSENNPDNTSGNTSLTARIDPKLKFILSIICAVDKISLGDVLERAFWGKENGNDEGSGNQYRVEEFRKIVEFVENQKVNISFRIDEKLSKIIDEGAKEQGIAKVQIIESSLWDYVEKEGFERSPVTGDYIKITVELPGRFKEYVSKA